MHAYRIATSNALPHCTAISTLRLAIIPANMVRRDSIPPLWPKSLEA